jgi:signal transduction histidine kinase
LELTKTTPKALMENTLSFLKIPPEIKIADATENKPKVKADTEKMVRVFVNVIQNAIDAMPEGGTLKIKSRTQKDNLIFTFKDSGTGMSKETLRNLWTPLFTTKARGMGFGLPICKRMVEAHDGKLSVKSKIGKGTTITVTIPVNPKQTNKREEKWIFSEPMLSTITTAPRNKKAKALH